MKINNYIRDIEDFPIAGITFKDITPLLGNALAFAEAKKQLLKLAEGYKIDKVVSMESRGFFFGPLIAQELEAGFIPVRKPGKLPAEVAKITYDLEYGKDTLEIHKDAINVGDKVLIHDDVLATGGTAAATVALVEQLGGVVVQCNFLINLTFLRGQSKLGNYTVKSVIDY